MIKLGHIGLSSVLSYPISVLLTYFHGVEYGFLFIIITVGLASLPDIDEMLNTLTKDGSLSFVPFVITHRGFTHTVYFSAILFIVSYIPATILLTDIVLILTVSTAVGLSTTFHALGDIFTPMGVDVFPPLTSNLGLEWFYYDNVVANVGLYIIGVFTIILVILIGYMGSYKYIVVTISIPVIFASVYIVLKLAIQSEDRMNDFEF